MNKMHKRISASPLRYPGGKGSLYSYFVELLGVNDLQGGTYVEPYAGGAGSALNLLVTDNVRQIVINDLDPAIYAFWLAVVNHNREFLEKIERVPLTIEEWKIQKQIFREGDLSKPLELGFATFFLNRTNRSGVMNAGPIGGMDQSGNYLIDARFNRRRLEEKVRLIGLYDRNIVLRNSDGIDVLREWSTAPKTFIYADPPYFNKAGSLYLNSFQPSDHEDLAAELNGRSTVPWLLTYDDVPQVKDLYCERRIRSKTLNYSAYRASKATELLVLSDVVVDVV